MANKIQQGQIEGLRDRLSAIDATIAATGAELYGEINDLSDELSTDIETTGANLYSMINVSTGVIMSHLVLTGLGLYDYIDEVSGNLPSTSDIQDLQDQIDILDADIDTISGKVTIISGDLLLVSGLARNPTGSLPVTGWQLSSNPLPNSNFAHYLNGNFSVTAPNLSFYDSASFNVSGDGQINLSTDTSTINLKSYSNININAGDDLNIFTSNDISVTSTGQTDLNATGSINLNTLSDINFTAANGFDFLANGTDSWLRSGDFRIKAEVVGMYSQILGDDERLYLDGKNGAATLYLGEKFDNYNAYLTSSEDIKIDASAGTVKISSLRINVAGSLPTSAAGLSPGDLWNSGDIVVVAS